MKKKENKFIVLRLMCLLSTLNGGLLEELTNVNYYKYKEEFVKNYGKDEILTFLTL